jgi:DNA-binding transcriptional regulator YiaG
MQTFSEFSGSLLKEQREARALSRPALAELLGVTAQAVYDWETGRKKPGLDNLRAIGKVFGIIFY